MSNFDAYVLAIVVAVIVLAALGSAVFLVSYQRATRRLLGAGEGAQSRRTQRAVLAGPRRRRGPRRSR